MTVYRESSQRKAIISFLQGRKDHPSASAIYNVLKQNLPNLSLGTVYRNLEILERQGRIRSLNLAQNEARFDGQVEKHGHFICHKCGQIEDIELKEGCCQLTDVLNEKGHTIEKINIDFIGNCSQCISTSKGGK